MDTSIQNDPIEIFNGKMIHKIKEVISTFSKLSENSFDVLSSYLPNRESLTGLGYSVFLTTDKHALITFEVTNISKHDIALIEHTTPGENVPVTSFDVDGTLQVKITIEDNLAIPLDSLLKSCEVIADALLIPYVKVDDYSKLNYCNGSVIMDYTLLYILSFGESLYNQYGYVSIDHPVDHELNQQTINGTMRSFLEKLFGSMKIDDILKDFSDNIEVIDKDVYKDDVKVTENATYSDDMKVCDFFKQILDYFHSLVEDPDKIIKLCNSDKSKDYSDMSKRIISVFNQVNRICNRLNDQMDTGSSVLSYNRTLYKDISKKTPTKPITGTTGTVGEQTSMTPIAETTGTVGEQSTESSGEQPTEVSTAESTGTVGEQPYEVSNTETMGEHPVKSSDEETIETSDEETDELPGEQPPEENSEESTEPLGEQSSEENGEESIESPGEQTSEPSKQISEQKTETTPSNMPGLFAPGIAGGSAHPNVDLIRLPFNGGGKKTSRRKHRNKTNKHVKKNKNQSKKYGGKTHKWNFLNIMS